jgi:pantoate--beta-alanine ligase
MAKLNSISSINEMTKKRSAFKPAQTIGLVPTMGYLHKGHLSLVQKAREENDIVIVSIFVNPTQFGPKEDLSRYPRDLEKDIAKLKKLAVDIVFTPTAEEIYPEGFNTYVDPRGLLATEAEGKMRPGHFRGMATVVLLLFELVKPTKAYFGQKDAQQALIVSQMIRDFNLDINLQVLPIVREKDGLAMSSRNAYLNTAERKAAPSLYNALILAKESLSLNATQHSQILKNLITTTFAKEPLVELEYIEIRHQNNFVELETVTAPAILLIAAKVGKTRLIDNFVLQEDNTWNTGVLI